MGTSTTLKQATAPGDARHPSWLVRLKRMLVALYELLRDAGIRWSDDACYRLGSSLAYAALFSLFPLLLLAVTGVGFVLGGDESARQKLLSSIAGAASPASRAMLNETLRDMQTHTTARGIGAAVGIVTLVIGASGVFAELQSTLNLIWRVPAPASASVWTTVLGAIKAKAFSFAVVIVAACALLASLVASTALAAVANAAQHVTGGAATWAATWSVLEFFFSLGVLTVVLAAVYRLVPQTHVRWLDVAGGALLAAFLFTALKSLLAWYLAHIASYAAYGAVGAVLGLLTWIYIASLVLFYGAEFTRVFAERFGSLSRSPRAARPETR